MNFKNTLEALLAINQISVKELSHRLNISQSSISQFNTKKPSYETLIELTKILSKSVSVDFLAFGEDCKFIRYPQLMKDIGQVKDIQYIKKTLALFPTGKPSLTDEPIKLTSSIHENLKILLKTKSLTAGELADKIQVAPYTVDRYLSGKIDKIPFTRLGEISDVLGVSISLLITGEPLTADVPKGLREIAMKFDRCASIGEAHLMAGLVEKILKNETAGG